MSYVSIAISLLIAAIVIATAVMLYTKGRGDQGTGKGIEAPIPRAQAVACVGQVRKLQAAAGMYCADSGYFPARLEDIPELSGEDLRCPVGGEAYRYDRNTGRVTCSSHR